VRLVLPDELVTLLGSAQAAAAEAKEALILGLLRDARISQGKAALLLGLTRWEMLDLMARHRIPSGPETPEELEQEVEYLRRLPRTDEARGGDQR
jgi:predicted HTH domain antitoxin